MLYTVFALLGLYLIAMPFYVFASGLPQPSDFILSLAFALFIIYCVARARAPLRADLRQLALVMLAFTTYVVCIGLWWTAAAGDIRVGLFPLFYIFNFLAFFLVLSLYSSDPAKTLSAIAVSATDK